MAVSAQTIFLTPYIAHVFQHSSLANRQNVDSKQMQSMSTAYSELNFWSHFWVSFLKHKD